MSCVPETILASAGQFTGLSENQLEAIQVQLLCDIRDALSSGAGFTGTPGSIPFAGATGTLTENNAKLFWDSSNVALRVGDRTSTYSLFSPDVNHVNGIFADREVSGAYTHVPASIYGATLLTGTGTTSVVGTGSYFEMVSGATASNGIGHFGIALQTGGTISGTLQGLQFATECFGGTSGNVEGIKLLNLIGNLVGTALCSGNFTGLSITNSLISGTISGNEYGAKIVTGGTGTTVSGTRYGLRVELGAAVTKGISVKTAATPSGNVFEHIDSGNAVVMSIDSGGQIHLNNAAVAETPTATHTLKIKDSGGTEYRILAVP